MYLFLTAEKRRQSFKLGDTLLHVLANQSKIADIQRLLNTMTFDERSRMLAARNHAGKTPLEVTPSYKVRLLLEWSDSQQGFYYLQTPPVVLMVAMTKGREEGADEEIKQLENAFPVFHVFVDKVVNPSYKPMLRSIREVCHSQADESALIVIIMAHGVQGRVWAGDGKAVAIQELLLQMQASAPPGTPKV